MLKLDGYGVVILTPELKTLGHAADYLAGRVSAYRQKLERTNPRYRLAAQARLKAYSEAYNIVVAHLQALYNSERAELMEEKRRDWASDVDWATE
jgi:hypothetical protein